MIQPKLGRAASNLPIRMASRLSKSSSKKLPVGHREPASLATTTKKERVAQYTEAFTCAERSRDWRLGWHWVYLDDANAIFLRRLLMDAGLFFLALIATALLGYLISRSITEPLSSLAIKIIRLAKGDLDIPPARPAEKTELGDIARAVDQFVRQQLSNRGRFNGGCRSRTNLRLNKRKRRNRRSEQRLSFCLTCRMNCERRCTAFSVTQKIAFPLLKKETCKASENT